MLCLGALGDRYGRKLMSLLGMGLSVPASCWLRCATDGVLFAARVLGGLRRAMAFPTTLALIAALWSGPARTRPIALWSAIGGGIAILGPLVAGAPRELRVGFGLPDHVTAGRVALLHGLTFRPAHVNESTEPVDNLGGILSAVIVGALILSINFVTVPDT